LKRIKQIAGPDRIKASRYSNQKGLLSNNALLAYELKKLCLKVIRLGRFIILCPSASRLPSLRAFEPMTYELKMLSSLRDFLRKESRADLTSFIWKLEKKNNPDNLVNPV
jgi:hypothetical protein